MYYKCRHFRLKDIFITGTFLYCQVWGSGTSTDSIDLVLSKM